MSSTPDQGVTAGPVPATSSGGALPEPDSPHASGQVRSNVRRGAWEDWWEGTRRADIWLTLGWFDIVLRYRRSMLGPLWLTLSMAAMIAGMGPLYASLFGTELSTFFPHLALGIIFWTFFTTLVTESCNAFVSSANYLKQGYFPISMFVWRAMTRNLIVFAHQIIIYIPVALFTHISLSWSALLFIPAFLLMLINAHAIGLVLGLICTRYRDVTQIVTSVMQLLMFLTPVFWLPESLPDRAKYVLYNPFAQMLDLLRRPLMGGVSDMHNWWGILGWTAAGLIASAWLFRRYRRRVVYWL